MIATDQPILMYLLPKFRAHLTFPYPACSQHLPEGHQDKPPDDWFSRTVARVTASVVAEASTAFGYEVSFTSFGGAFTLSTVLVPTLNMELYWIGAFGSWRYIMKRKTQIES
uniref:Uncharacterized protein n=1 Tax=Chaetoceros debilis TaxID=122233 RepID=A0A7S3Q763_9STRA